MSGSSKAPIYGPEETLLLALAVVPEGRRVRDLPVLSGALLRSTGRVMAAIDGRAPSRPRSR